MTWLVVLMACAFLVCCALAGLVFVKALGGPTGLRRAIRSLRR